MNPGAVPQARSECCAFGARQFWQHPKDSTECMRLWCNTILERCSRLQDECRGFGANRYHAFGLPTQVGMEVLSKSLIEIFDQIVGILEADR